MTSKRFNDIFGEEREFQVQVHVEGERNSDGSAQWETFHHYDSYTEAVEWIDKTCKALAEQEKDEFVKTKAVFRVRMATWKTGTVRTYPGDKE